MDPRDDVSRSYQHPQLSTSIPVRFPMDCIILIVSSTYMD